MSPIANDSTGDQSPPTADLTANIGAPADLVQPKKIQMPYEKHSELPASPYEQKLFAGVLSTDGKTNLTEIITPTTAFFLWWFLNNRNHPCSYATEAIEKGRLVRRRSPFFVEADIFDAVETVAGRRKSGAEKAFIPYCTDLWTKDRSRYGGIRFSAAPTAPQRVLQALISFRSCLRHMVLLEHGGGGEFQLWAIANLFVKNSEWIAFLRGVVTQAEIDSGICEIFPNPDAPGFGDGIGMRAPGSWNPRTGTISEILYHDLPKFAGRVLRPSSQYLFPDPARRRRTR